MAEISGIERVTGDIWRFSEEFIDVGPNVANCYLVVGKEKAALIDTLVETEELYDVVRKITEKPLVCLVTHGHLDHAGFAMKQFREHGVPVYMDLKDLPTLNEQGGFSYTEDMFEELREGMTFDLGGTVLETISVPGHSKGCKVFFDETHCRLFAGDSVGSGPLWLILPGAAPVRKFRDAMRALWKRIGRYEKQLTLYVGHPHQSRVPLTADYIRDVLACAEGVMDGTIESVPRQMQVRAWTINYMRARKGSMWSFCYFAPDGGQETQGDAL